MSQLPDFEAWAVFARVVEIGSFSKAAAVLGMSPPTVSKTIGRLEARLGTALLHRTSRHFSLTPTGVIALEKARQILLEGETAEAEVTDHVGKPAGLVRVAAPASFGRHYLMPLLPEFMALHPLVRIELSLSDRFVDLVADGFDIALRVGALTDSSLRVRRLCAVRWLLVGSPSYLAGQGRPRHPRELSGHECLIYANRSSPELWRFRAIDGGEQAVTVRGRLKVDNAEALLPELLAGRGLAVMPEFLVHEELAAGRLEKVLPEWQTDCTVLNLVMPPSRLRPASVTALMDHLVQSLAIAPPWMACADNTPQTTKSRDKKDIFDKMLAIGK